MTETVEPNPKLIEYYSISKSLFTDFDDKKNEFDSEQEWHYILSNLDQNIFLLKRLDDLNLLKDSIKMVDCGIGLGTTLYDFYLQSKEFKNKTFYFTGIEKHEIYTEFLKKNLLEKWNGELTLIEDDIINQNYGDYDIVYTYTPFINKEKLWDADVKKRKKRY